MRLLHAVAAICILPFLGLAADKPINALIITGGCCHNYPFQSAAITNAIGKVANVKWTIWMDPSKGTRGQTNPYDDPKWAEPFDVIIHNECFADTDDPAYIRKVTVPQVGKPAIVLHCAMHTYRASKADDWREFLGVTSRRHDHLDKYTVAPADPAHPIMKGFPESWTTPPDELYVIEKLWPNAKALATAVSKEDGKTYPTSWINNYQGNTRVFGTTFGHSDDTFKDPVYLNLLANAFLWVTGKTK